MGDTGHRSTAAVVDVGHGAGDGAGGGDAADERGHHVGDALGDELLIAVVTVADDAIGHSRGEERLNGAQHGDDHGRLRQPRDGLPVELRHGGRRQGR